MYHSGGTVTPPAPQAMSLVTSLVMTRLEVVTKLELELVAMLLTVLGEAVWTTGAMP